MLHGHPRDGIHTGVHSVGGGAAAPVLYSMPSWSGTAGLTKIPTVIPHLLFVSGGSARRQPHVRPAVAGGGGVSWWEHPRRTASFRDKAGLKETGASPAGSQHPSQQEKPGRHPQIPSPQLRVRATAPHHTSRDQLCSVTRARARAPPPPQSTPTLAPHGRVLGTACAAHHSTTTSRSPPGDFHVVPLTSARPRHASTTRPSCPLPPGTDHFVSLSLSSPPACGRKRASRPMHSEPAPLRPTLMGSHQKYFGLEMHSRHTAVPSRGSPRALPPRPRRPSDE